MQRVLPLVLTAMLAGCGGGVSQAVLPSGAQSSGSSTAASASSTARFTLAVPARSAQAQSRNPQYISVNTQSVIITLATVNGTAFAGPQAETAANLTTSNPSCSGSPLTCAIVVPGAPGTDVFNVTTYSAPQTGNAPATPAGSVLSTGAVTVTVVSGQANAPATALVLNGVAASVVATFPTDPHISGTQSAGYPIVGSQPYALTVSPVDASGATIVGDGAPTFTVTSGTTAVAVSSSGTDTFAVEVHGYRSAPVNLTIAPSSGSATTIALTTVQEMWVSHYTTNTVVAYGLSATPAQITTDTITAGLATPVGVAVDASGNVWIANSFSNSVAAYVPGTSTPIAGDTITAGLSLPEDLAFDASGHLWVANHNGNNVTAYTVSPTPVQITADTITAGLTTPAAVAFDASGILWVGNQVSTTINAYAPGTNSVITADMISPVVNNNIRFDATGRLWVANQSTGAVSAYAPGTSAPTSGDTIPGTGPAGAIAFSP